MNRKRILFLAPFHSGSHKTWAEQLKKHSYHQIDFIICPVRNWQWAMSASALYFAQKILDEITDFPKKYDLILTDEFTSVHQLQGHLMRLLYSRGASPNVYEKMLKLPIITYFHENQINYPNIGDKEISKNRVDHHYSFHHLENLECSNKVIFNSQFHLDLLLNSLNEIQSQWPMKSNLVDLEQIRKKSIVIAPGIDIPKEFINPIKELGDNGPLILWNHRWDEDKNPEEFFNIIVDLYKDGFQFQLALLGLGHRKETYLERFRETMPKDKIKYDHAKDRNHYLQILCESHIQPVTSFHDFFGLSVVEAIVCGVKSFVPNRCAYHEHFHSDELQLFQYQDKFELIDKIQKWESLSIEKSLDKCLGYQWNETIRTYDFNFNLHFNLVKKEI